MGEGRNSPEVHWVNPELRGIIPLSRVAPVRSLRRALRNTSCAITVDTSFRQVIEMCAEATGDRPDTWINQKIIDLYNDLYVEGYAHSVECWANGSLVGGLYGVSIGAAFFGESMFSREPNASKVALAHLVQRLVRGNYMLLDIQFVTEHLSRLGAVEISREQYLGYLAGAVGGTANFYSIGSTAGSDSICTSG